MQDKCDFSGASKNPIKGDQYPQAAIDMFIDHARSCCDVIERMSEGKEHEHFRQLFTNLCLLTGVAIQLPKSTLTIDDEYKSLMMSSDERNALADKIQNQIRTECRAISESHRAFPEQYEMLFDDLADLYKDLRDGLRIWDLETSEAQGQALWHWAFYFENHTARHLFHALSTIYEIMYHFDLFDT